MSDIPAEYRAKSPVKPKRTAKGRLPKAAGELMTIVNAALVRPLPAELPEGTPAPRVTRPSNRMKRRILLFLEKLSAGWSVRAACKAATISYSRVYQLRRLSPAFSRAWDMAREQSLDLVEDELRKLVFGGNVTAIIFWLKSNSPEKYREHYEGGFKGVVAAEGAPVVQWDMEFRLGTDPGS